MDCSCVSIGCETGNELAILKSALGYYTYISKSTYAAHEGREQWRKYCREEMISALTTWQDILYVCVTGSAERGHDSGAALKLWVNLPLYMRTHVQTWIVLFFSVLQTPDNSGKCEGTIYSLHTVIHSTWNWVVSVIGSEKDFCFSHRHSSVI